MQGAINARGIKTGVERRWWAALVFPPHPPGRDNWWFFLHSVFSISNQVGIREQSAEKERLCMSQNSFFFSFHSLIYVNICTDSIVGIPVYILINASFLRKPSNQLSLLYTNCISWAPSTGQHTSAQIPRIWLWINKKNDFVSFFTKIK